MKMKQRRMKSIEIYFLTVFVIFLIASVLCALVLNMQQVSLVLLLIDFPIAIITAVYASLSIREEEEEKTQVST